MSLIAKMPGPPASRSEIERFFDNLKETCLKAHDSGRFDIWVVLNQGTIDVRGRDGQLEDVMYTGEWDQIIQARHRW